MWNQRMDGWPRRWVNIPCDAGIPEPKAEGLSSQTREELPQSTAESEGAHWSLQACLTARPRCSTPTPSCPPCTLL